MLRWTSLSLGSSLSSWLNPVLHDTTSFNSESLIPTLHRVGHGYSGVRNFFFIWDRDTLRSRDVWISEFCMLCRYRLSSSTIASVLVRAIVTIVHKCNVPLFNKGSVPELRWYVKGVDCLVEFLVEYMTKISSSSGICVVSRYDWLVSTPIT